MATKSKRTAYYLKLLAKTDPKGQRASRLVKYLLNNRKHSTYWNSTRDSALCIEAMANYWKASGESEPNLNLTILVDGKVYKKVTVTRENLFTFDGTLLIEGAKLTAGKHTVTFQKDGTSPVYWNGYVTNFTLEDYITKAGLEIKVKRKFFLLKKVKAKATVAGSRGQVIDQNVEKYERIELPNGAPNKNAGGEVVDMALLKSGDLIEVELEIDSKNDYEYVIFEDMKAAGFEPVGHPLRLHQIRKRCLRRIPRRTRRLLHANPAPWKKQRQLSPTCRNSRPILRVTRQSMGNVRPRVKSKLRRKQSRHRRLIINAI